MTDVVIRELDQTFMKIECDTGIGFEIQALFTFMVPSARFDTRYKNRRWDGKIRLFSPFKKTLYKGLLDEVVRFCKKNSYTYEIDPHLLPIGLKYADHRKGFENYAKSISKIDLRDYQMDGFFTGLTLDRRLFLSPTASGKSLVIYLLARFKRERTHKPTLVIVPTIGLVTQMADDFQSYSPDKLSIQKIMGGQPKKVVENYVVSTWQSLYQMPQEYFNQFGCVIGDEAHMYKADAIKGMLEKCTNVRFRYGFTGTLDGALANEMVLRGLFGPVSRLSTTTKLIEDGHISKLRIGIVVLGHSKAARKAVEAMDYKAEIQYLIGHSGRNEMIRDFVLSLRGNTLVLFNFVENHGKPLYETFRKKSDNTFLIHGGVEANDREAIKSVMEQGQDVKVLASFGTFSTGINVKRIHHVVFASPVKNRIRLLQSIGRGLRLATDKDQCKVWDFADDLRVFSKTGKLSRANHSFRHLEARVSTYDQEGFEYSFTNVVMEDPDDLPLVKKTLL